MPYHVLTPIRFGSHAQKRKPNRGNLKGRKMKKLLCIGFLSIFSTSAMSFEILALGTSDTNCKGVDRSKIFPVHLEELLGADGFDVHVINGGVDGDKPVWMVNRLAGAINEKTRLVIFEPGSNDKNKASNVEYSEKILSQMQDRKMPTIYISQRIIQTDEEGEATAKQFGAYYYGHWGRDVPRDRIYRQFDMANGGHMTAEGCQLWAKNIAPLVKSILLERDIK